MRLPVGVAKVGAEAGAERREKVVVLVKVAILADGHQPNIAPRAHHVGFAGAMSYQGGTATKRRERHEARSVHWPWHLDARDTR